MQGSLEGGKAGKGFLPRERNTPREGTDVGLWIPRTEREHVYVVLSL